MNCSVSDCSAPGYAHELCNRHYLRARKYGDPSQPSLTAEERFWLKVDKDTVDGCWLWIGAKKPSGYGGFRGTQAHRWIWVHLNGSIPEELEVDHFFCNRRDCVNPQHLRLVSRRENVLRSNNFAAWNAAKTHCPKGHEYDEDNTYISKRGERKCRACRRKPSTYAHRVQEILDTIEFD